MKLTHFINIVLFIALVILSIFYYFEREDFKKNQINSQKEYKEKLEKLEDSNTEIKKENSKLNSSNTELEKEAKTLKNKLLEKKEIVQVEEKQITKTLQSEENKVITNSLSFVKKLEYKTQDLPISISELTNFEKAKLQNAIKETSKKINQNQFILIEGNADSLSFAQDPENYKNIDLAFKRALKAVLNLDEETINRLFFKINTNANDRDIKIFICYYE